MTTNRTGEPVCSPTGSDRLKKAIQMRRDHARKTDPQPYDSGWGWWVDHRLTRLEGNTRWIIVLALTLAPLRQKWPGCGRGAALW